MKLNRETVFSTTVGVAIGSIVAVVSATWYVSGKINEFEELRSELEELRNELAMANKKVEYLDCEVKRQNHAFDFIFSDLHKMLYGISNDPQDIQNMMGPVLNSRREAFKDEKCYS